MVRAVPRAKDSSACGPPSPAVRNSSFGTGANVPGHPQHQCQTHHDAELHVRASVTKTCWLVVHVCIVDALVTCHCRKSENSGGSAAAIANLPCLRKYLYARTHVV